jgi:hypothetical protein
MFQYLIYRLCFLSFSFILFLSRIFFSSLSLSVSLSCFDSLSLYLVSSFSQVLNEPIYLQLEDLLKMQQNNETRLQMERVWLNVNLLIHFLNTNFLGSK